jgi:hypothetical protein
VRNLRFLAQPSGKYVIIENNDGGLFPPGPKTINKAGMLEPEPLWI